MSSPTLLNKPNQVILGGYILPSKYVLGPAIKIVLLLAFAYASSIELSFLSISIFRTCKYTTKMLIFECAHNATIVINLLFFGLVIIFAFNMEFFREFISNIQLLSLESDSLSVRTIKQNRRKILVLLTVTFIFFTIVTYKRDKVSSIHTVNPVVFTLLFFHETLIRFGLLFLLNMICNICFCLKAAFHQINSQIIALNTTSDQPIDHLFHKIRSLRKKYSFAVRSTQSAEKLFRYYITLFYTEYFSFITMNIVRSFGPKTSIDSVWLTYISLDTILFIILTYNLVSVNNLSRQGLEDLYELSFKLNTPESCHENDIFIARMALSDVGFTFANLFTINNNFIASLFTLSLTLIIALVNFIYK